MVGHLRTSRKWGGRQTRARFCTLPSRVRGASRCRLTLEPHVRSAAPCSGCAYATVALRVELARGPREAEGEVRPHGHVASALRMQVVALAAARFPHCAPRLLLQLLVEAVLRVTLDLERGQLVLAHEPERL